MSRYFRNRIKDEILLKYITHGSRIITHYVVIKQNGAFTMNVQSISKWRSEIQKSLSATLSQRVSARWTYRYSEI